jgi:hypothetical protein
MISSRGLKMSNRPSFVATSRSWYAATALGGLDERVIIMSADGKAELFLEWKDAQDTPVLVVHHDSWSVMLSEFTGILRHLAHQKNKAASPAEVCAYLSRVGFEDATEQTEQERPAAANVTPLHRGERRP